MVPWRNRESAPMMGRLSSTSVRLLLASTLLLACVGEPVFVGTGGAGGTTSATAPITGTGGATSAASSASVSTGSSDTCGDYVVDPGEMCEDGNQAAGDGCSPTCGLEATCGNGTVEPGELCDGQPDCTSCLLSPSSACNGAVMLTVGSNTVTHGPALDAVGAGANCPAPVRAIGQLDVGPQAAIVAVFPVDPIDDYVLRWGCSGPFVVPGCGSPVVTPLLPAHSIVWVGAAAGSEGVAETFFIQLARYGSLFDDPGGMVDQGGGSAWAHDAGASHWRATVAGANKAVLQSPPIDLRGVAAPVVHFWHNLAPPAPPLSTVEYSTDGMTWLAAATFTVTGNQESEVPIPDASGAEAALVRFVAEGDGQWTLYDVFVGPPFAP
jgi:cysteine-rich repeat protein